MDGECCSFGAFLHVCASALGEGGGKCALCCAVMCCGDQQGCNLDEDSPIFLRNLTSFFSYIRVRIPPLSLALSPISVVDSFPHPGGLVILFLLSLSLSQSKQVSHTFCWLLGQRDTSTLPQRGIDRIWFGAGWKARGFVWGK